MEKQITKVAIFDFDGTLVDTPLKEEGMAIFQEKTGNKWPHRGWWGQPDSLDTDIFEMPLVPSVKADYDALKDDEGTYKVLLTGRRDIMGDKVKEILDTHGLDFAEYHFNTGGATETIKMRVMSKLINKFPDAELHIWEDRVEHIAIFATYLQEKVDTGKLKGFTITLVPANRH
jgi:FMN phosphatase YigB (HAD superfamily)